MNSEEVRKMIMPLTGGTGSCKITKAPDPSRSPKTFWTEANKHKELKDRDRQLIAAYFEIAARTGVAARSDGIALDDGGYLQPDKAVMNAGITAGWLDVRDDTHVFVLTAEGWRGVAGIAFAAQ